jgi:ubiquitin
LLVKSGTEEDGIKAWQKLYRHYHRKTFARAIRDHREILYPRPLRYMSEVPTAVMEWEDKLTKVEKEYEAIPEMLKMAALVEMMPNEIKDMVFMTTDESTKDYEKLKQRIFAWAANKASAQSGPVPMDVGKVSYCEQGNYEDEAEVDVAVVSGGAVCYRCGGWGHLSRDCPTPPKGKGKGGAEKGKGKGGGKDGYSSKGWNKGKGKEKG